MTNTSASVATRPALGVIRIAVVIVVTAVAALAGFGWLFAVDHLGERAQKWEALSSRDRKLGYRSPRGVEVIVDPALVTRAIEQMPDHASFAVVFGPEWRSTRSSIWSDSLETDLLDFQLYPRRRTGVQAARWLFCFACAQDRLGRRFQTRLTSDSSRLSFGKLAN